MSEVNCGEAMKKLQSVFKINDLEVVDTGKTLKDLRIFIFEDEGYEESAILFFVNSGGTIVFEIEINASGGMEGSASLGVYFKEGRK